jgi:hypothetical protein
MSSSSRDRDDDRSTAGEGRDDADYLQSEPLDPEKPAAEKPEVGVEDVVEFFDREPPERPASDADVQPPG